MSNKVFYGEYTLDHWVQLILSKNIILPEYQRSYVWSKENVKEFARSLSEDLFIPPVTIGVMSKQNLLLDGQQRLSSLLLLYLGIFPKKDAFSQLDLEESNDSEIEQEDEDESTTPIDWTFKLLIGKGMDRTNILSNISDKYEHEEWFSSEEERDQIFKSKLLGFSYLVPDEQGAQAYFSSTFRNINSRGTALTAQESREAFYYINPDIKSVFTHPIRERLLLKPHNKERSSKLDLVRYFALLQQYQNKEIVAKGTRGNSVLLENLYVRYLADVKLPSDTLDRMQSLEGAIGVLELPRDFPSIIDMDLYCMGLIYHIIFEGKQLKPDASNLRTEIEEAIKRIKPASSRSPSQLRYLRERIDVSIKIYSKYVQ